jgi:hypothetical protein
MDSNLFKIAGVVAGIGGIAVATVVFILREFIRQEIFTPKTKHQTYKLLKPQNVLSIVIGALGIGAYIVTAKWNGVVESNQNTTTTPVKADLSGTVLDQNERPVRGARITLDDIPGTQAVETSSAGVFNLRDIPKRYGEGVRIRVTMEGYEPNPYTEDVVLGKAPPIIKLNKKK